MIGSSNLPIATKSINDRRSTMTNTNAAKAKQLGMPFGTACNRLRKLILFRLLVRLNENVCFKCATQIDKVEELSVEHKKPWFNVDASFFWDLENIAFSHLLCNRPDRDPSIARRIIPPEGMSWCTGHQKFETVDQFRPKGDSTNNPRWRWNGLDRFCRTYHVERTARQRETRKQSPL